MDNSTLREPTAYDPPVLACNMPPPFYGDPAVSTPEGACSCTDCERACAPPDLSRYTDDSDDFEVKYGATVGVVFVLGIVAMAILFIWQRKRKVEIKLQYGTYEKKK